MFTIDDLMEKAKDGTNICIIWDREGFNKE